MFEELVIRTKLTPPRARRFTLLRPRLTARLAEAIDHRVTIVHAGTGYGKSTALAALSHRNTPLCWYSIAEEDTDPFVFFLHLVYAFRLMLSTLSDAPLAYLERYTEQLGPTAWNMAVNVLISALAEVLDQPTLLILDDYHIVDDIPQIARMVDRLIGYAPTDLHVVLSGRRAPDLPGLVVWRARGELLEITGSELAFTPDEVSTLYDERYDYRLNPTELESLVRRTEGWAIALQLFWQGLRAGAITDLTSRPLVFANRLSTQDLFTYLAQEVFNRQPPDVQHFLSTTSILRQMNPGVCDALCTANDSAVLLSYLFDRDLFLMDLGDGQSRYHRLFQEFLREKLSRDWARELHHRAADYHSSMGDDESAIHHLLEAGAFRKAADVMDVASVAMVRQGRLDTLAGWVGQLPPSVLEDHPILLTCLGDIARLRSHFEEALGWYMQAETHWLSRGDRMGASRALQGQALVYLDTVRPAQAESLLVEALRLSEGQQDRQDRARLLELMAENKLNLGRLEEAERLRSDAQQWREEGPSESQLGVRVLIRTGKLDQARVILEAQTGIDTDPDERFGSSRAHQSHREAQLLLALIYAFFGKAEAAFSAAEAGIAIGQQTGSPFVTAVGYMRLGHAWLIRNVPDAHLRAIDCYKQAIALGDALAVRRTRVEAQWGLCRAYGFHGDLPAAEEAAAVGIEIGDRAGDPWVVALIELTLGAGYVLADRQADAMPILRRVVASFGDCSDSYGRTAAYLWLGLAYLQLGQIERVAASTDELLHLTEIHGYEHLFTERALLGPPDCRILVPLLIEARRHRRRPGAAARLLTAAGLPNVEYHPGYQLRVQTLGPFQVWRGKDEIDAREWRRVKARQLFQLLITHRGKNLQREEIVDILWPDLDSEAVQRDFKVALNALNKALEPRRAQGAESAFISRRGTTYGLRHEADIWLDADEFLRLMNLGDELRDDPTASGDAYQRALNLYRGDYLPDVLYEDWASEERERLFTVYLRTAEKLASVRVEQGRHDEAIALCHRILASDDCWERAYRLMMVSYARQGNRPQALRVFQTCEQTLQRELNTLPGPTTQRLKDRISNGSPSENLVA